VADLQILRPANPLVWVQIPNNWRERARAETCARSAARLHQFAIILSAEKLQDDVARIQCADMCRRRRSAALRGPRRRICNSGSSAILVDAAFPAPEWDHNEVAQADPNRLQSLSARASLHARAGSQVVREVSRPYRKRFALRTPWREPDRDLRRKNRRRPTTSCEERANDHRLERSCRTRPLDRARRP
jgi:hypothetical protein